MDLKTIRNSIVYQINGLVALPVIFTPTVAPLPSYPFVTYSFISTYLDGASHEEVTEATGDWVNRELVTQSEFTMSFNAYSLDSMESKSLIKAIWDYFKHTGYHKLKEIDLVVVEVGNINNLDVLDINKYERREGFDVRFRTIDRTSRPTETIKTYNINSTVS